MTNAIIHLYKYWKENGWEKTKQEWIYQYAILDSPEQLIKKEIIGYIGSIFGMIFAGAFLIFQGSWYFIFAIIFGIYILYVNLKMKLKQLQGLRDIKKQFEEAVGIEAE